ncbi:MAG: hypothetical protein ACOC7N_03380, partial [Chloroflexota bacterium]
MNRLKTHSGWGIILLCLCLGSCVLPNSASPRMSSALAAELSIEEHALKDGADLEPLTFVPVEGTREEILSKHQAKRATSARTPCRAECEASLGDESLVASIAITDTGDGGQKVFAEVLRDGETVYSAQLGGSVRCS